MNIKQVCKMNVPFYTTEANHPLAQLFLIQILYTRNETGSCWYNIQRALVSSNEYKYLICLYPRPVFQKKSSQVMSYLNLMSIT